MASPSPALQEELGKTVAATIRPLSLGFGLFIGYTAWTELPLASTSHWPIFAADVLVSAYLLGLFAWLQWRPPPLSWMNGLGASVGIALAGTDMVTNAVRASVPSFPAFALVLAGLGAVVLSWRWMGGTIAGLWLAWIAMTQVYVGTTEHALFILQISTITGLAIHWGRMRAYTRLIAARAKEAEVREHLEIANEELDRFASVVAHDLKNPISALRLKAGLLRMKVQDPTLNRVAQELDRVAKGMGDMVTDLLHYARAGEPLVSTERVDMNEVLAQVEELFEERFDELGGAFETTPLPTIDSERILMVQLMQNLIGNALDHAREGVPPKIVVRGTNRGSSMYLEVQDNGVGIETKDIDNVFRPFAKGKDSVGHGLGLATCRRIVEKHGGWISVRSRKGEGSTFSVLLPSVGAEMAPAQPEAEPVPVPVTTL